MTRRAGLTLVELTVALALAAALTAVSLAVAGRLWRAEAGGRRLEEAGFLRDRLGSLLEADFLHAERCRCDGNEIQLQTHAALEARTLERDHVPALVSYRLRRLAGRWWLVRSQQVAQAAPFTEMVCPDAGRLSLKAAGGKDVTDWKQLPAAVTVAVELSDGRGRAEYRFNAK